MWSRRAAGPRRAGRCRPLPHSLCSVVLQLGDRDARVVVELQTRAAAASLQPLAHSMASVKNGTEAASDGRRKAEKRRVNGSRVVFRDGAIGVLLVRRICN